jgi:lipid A disaccharide synthetase
MRTVQVYIEGQRLDLFKDEIVSVTSKQQDVQDISKVFTDYSQSFSCPSTPNNDAIFQHFYQNDVNSTIDHNIRRNAYIEIDLTTFRTGTISLEKSEVKNNQAYSYQITFYGDIANLKTKFADDKLQDLTLLNIYSHNYTGTEVKNRIIDGNTNYVVRYPLIFNQRS